MGVMTGPAPETRLRAYVRATMPPAHRRLNFDVARAVRVNGRPRAILIRFLGRDPTVPREIRRCFSVRNSWRWVKDLSARQRRELDRLYRIRRMRGRRLGRFAIGDLRQAVLEGDGFEGLLKQTSPAIPESESFPPEERA